MALSNDEKDRLLAKNLPDDAAVRTRLERWVAETGYNDFDVADKIGRSRSAVSLFRIGRYGDKPNDSLALREALVELMDANPTTLDRSLKGQTYQTESARKVRRAFFNAVNRGWVYCIDGAPGTQKTRLLLGLCMELEAADAHKNGHARRVLYIYCRKRMSRTDLVREILLAAGLAPRGWLGKMIRKVRHHLSSRRVLLVLDEAHHLDDDALETVRELVDEPPYFGLLFAGSHDLKLKFHHLKLEQWRSRVQRFIELEGLREEEVRDIWAKEIGRIGEKDFKDLMKYCQVKDFRPRRPGEPPREYLSARQLFFAIEQHKAQDQGEGE